MDVRFTIDGKPLAAAFDSLVKGVMDAGDSDHDGQSTWKELAAERTYLEKEMPNAPAADSRQMKTLIERYDENRDGKIQTAEAAAWLGRDAGTSAKRLTVRSTRAYRPVPRATSQVWHLIDGDGDGRLTNDEIRGAPHRLLALDADDDRILAPAEMASLREQLEAAGLKRKFVALVLEDRGVLRGHQKVITPSGEGEITSGTFSPSMEKSIALARVPRDTGATVQVDVRGKLLNARVVKAPFVRHGQVLVQ